jgi:hypothetical protein
MARDLGSRHETFSLGQRFLDTIRRLRTSHRLGGEEGDSTRAPLIANYTCQLSPDHAICQKASS